MFSSCPILLSFSGLFRLLFLSFCSYLVDLELVPVRFSISVLLVSLFGEIHVFFFNPMTFHTRARAGTTVGAVSVRARVRPSPLGPHAAAAQTDAAASRCCSPRQPHLLLLLLTHAHAHPPADAPGRADAQLAAPAPQSRYVNSSRDLIFPSLTRVRLCPRRVALACRAGAPVLVLLRHVRRCRLSGSGARRHAQVSGDGFSRIKAEPRAGRA